MVPGRAVGYLARYASAVAITFPETSEYLRGRETVVTGLPVRVEIAGQPRFDDMPSDAFCVFVTGGSQGAHRVNELAVQALTLVKADLATVQETGAEAVFLAAGRRPVLPDIPGIGKAVTAEEVLKMDDKEVVSEMRFIPETPEGAVCM